MSTFATDDFFAGPDTALPALQAYLRHLVEVAHERGQPVFKFCRSLGRMGWMANPSPIPRISPSCAIRYRNSLRPGTRLRRTRIPISSSCPFGCSQGMPATRGAAALRHFAVHLPPEAADEDPVKAKATPMACLCRTVSALAGPISRGTARWRARSLKRGAGRAGWSTDRWRVPGLFGVTPDCLAWVAAGYSRSAEGSGQS